MLMSKDGSLREIYSITDYEPLSLSRYDQFFRTIEPPALRRLPNFTFTGILNTEATWPEFRLLDLLSTRFMIMSKNDVVTWRTLAEPGYRWHSVFNPAEGGSLVFENDAALPRAYVAHRTTIARSEDLALDAVTDPSFDARSAVVLETDGTPIPRLAALPPTPITPASITDYQPTRVVVETNAAHPGYLVLTDTYYPGWIATVDGTPATILRANFLFRAVAVEAGPHTVRFDLPAAELPSRCRIAGAGATGAVLALLLERRTRRRGAQRLMRAATSNTTAINPPTGISCAPNRRHRACAIS